MDAAELRRRSSIKPKNDKHGLARIVHTSAAAFLAADDNGDQKLTFTEFCNAIPEAHRASYSDETLLELFQMADADRSGSVSPDEFFFFTLSWVSKFSGFSTGLEALFSRYDSSGDGALNMLEFVACVKDLGFGHLGHRIFCELDQVPEEIWGHSIC